MSLVNTINQSYWSINTAHLATQATLLVYYQFRKNIVITSKYQSERENLIHQIGFLAISTIILHPRSSPLLNEDNFSTLEAAVFFYIFNLRLLFLRSVVFWPSQQTPKFDFIVHKRYTSQIRDSRTLKVRRRAISL